MNENRIGRPIRLYGGGWKWKGIQIRIHFLVRQQPKLTYVVWAHIQNEVNTRIDTAFAAIALCSLNFIVFYRSFLCAVFIRQFLLLRCFRIKAIALFFWQPYVNIIVVVAFIAHKINGLYKICLMNEIFCWPTQSQWSFFFQSKTIELRHFFPLINLHNFEVVSILEINKREVERQFGELS